MGILKEAYKALGHATRPLSVMEWKRRADAYEEDGDSSGAKYC